jgi:Na+-transporting methylmalonyl-CoA/oxaloacetate decarboxylase gamma subunit
VEFRDALSITALGMTVVFAGLFLTALLIVALNQLPDRFSGLRRRGEASGTPQAKAAPESPLGAEIVTVIATVLEIEHRLHHAERGKRLTIARHAGQQEGQG